DDQRMSFARCFGKRLNEARLAGRRVAIVARSGYERDSSITFLDEEPGHGLGAALVVDPDRRDARIGIVAVEQHCRDRWTKCFDEVLMLSVRRHYQQAVYAAAHRAHSARRLVRIAVHVAEQQLKSVRISDPIDPADELAEELAEQVRQDDAD